MQKMKYDKKWLLETLHKNRDAHKAIFEEASDGYRKKAIEVLESAIKAAREHKRFSLMFNLVQPVNQTKDYDRAIHMLENAMDSEIELDEMEYAQYVLDDWNWKRNFLHSNAMYSSTAATVAASFQEE